MSREWNRYFSEPIFIVTSKSIWYNAPMARGMYGKIIPKLSEIVRIDGKNVIDADGDVFDRGLVMAMKNFGFEGFEVISIEDMDAPPDQSDELKNQ